MTPPLIAFALVVSCLSSLAQCQANQTAEPDPASIVRAGLASLKRFETSSASWTTSTRIPSGAEFIVDVIAMPGARRLIFSAEAQGRRQELARLIQTEDVWYVTQGGRAAKYRPYEVPFDVPTLYMHLSRSTPQFIAENPPGGLGTFEGIQGHVATYRSPLPDAARKLLENIVAQFDQLQKQNPASIKPDLAKSMSQSKELLAKGLSTQVDLQTGMLIEFGSTERRTKVTGFQWLKQVDEKEFATEGRPWDDYTNDPTLGDRHQLVMLGHSGIWRPGLASSETDGRLLDLTTNRFRRIPFQGDIASTGCFSKDRTRVIIGGQNTMTATIGIYEINLKTTENRQLGGEALSTGISLFPTLSPDGKTVAVLHQEPNNRLLVLQIYLIDLASGEARKLGEPRDIGPISWFPDGKGLLMLDRDNTDRTKPSVETLARMDLNGQETKLCRGNTPVFVGDGTRILFKDPTSKTWKTCNHQGAEIQDYADGLKSHNFPAPSSDGKRLLMMHFQPGQAPEPVVFDVDSSEGKSLKLPPGLWGLPAWR